MRHSNKGEFFYLLNTQHVLVAHCSGLVLIWVFSKAFTARVVVCNLPPPTTFFVLSANDCEPPWYRVEPPWYRVDDLASLSHIFFVEVTKMSAHFFASDCECELHSFKLK